MILPQHGNATPQLKNYAQLRADDYGIDYFKFKRLVECESKWIHFIPNGKMITGDRGKAKGIMQFWRVTFDKYSYLFEDIFEREADYSSPYDQIDLSLLMLADNKENWRHWQNCSKKENIKNYKMSLLTEIR